MSRKCIKRKDMFGFCQFFSYIFCWDVSKIREIEKKIVYCKVFSIIQTMCRIMVHNINFILHKIFLFSVNTKYISSR